MSSEFEVLINTICNPSTNLTNRSTAEARLLDLLSNIHTWQQYITLFSSSNDMICFFLGIGYQRLVWRHWTDLSVEQHNLLLNTMKQALTNRPLMQNFTQAKIEQVLAAICCNLLNLDPILNMLVDVNQPQAVIGLSATRTVFDLIVSDDPKLNPKTKATLLQQIQSPQVLLPITNLAGSACAKALQSYNEDTLNLMTIALELLKIIIGKMTLGAHITVDILNLLFTIAELGADPKSVFHRTALSSIEILTEIMTKKYIPASTSGDRGISMVIHLVNKTLALLKSYR